MRADHVDRWRAPRKEARHGGLFRDLRHGVRLLAQQPGFSAIAVATLAIGIGAAASLFSLADAFLLRPLPVACPDRMVRVYGYHDGNRFYADFAALRDGASTLGGLAATQGAVLSLRVDGAPETVQGRLVSASYFEVLGLLPRAGRLLRPDDERTDGDVPVVISDRLWWRRFAGGIAVGLGLALVATRVLASLLYGVSATDPVTFASVSLTLVAATVLASVVPARRATRVDPVTALRLEG